VPDTAPQPDTRPGPGYQDQGGPVRPGTGWPEDPATPRTPVAASPEQVRELAASAGSVDELAARESVCRACPRLVAWREQVAAEKRRSFAAQTYWGRPVPGWGASDAPVLIVGLAPAAHGGNRTGRIFTGDRSGDVLFASLWRTGLAAQPTSVFAGDGQQLISSRMSAAVRCAPPANKPTTEERDACAPWLAAELGLLRADLRVIVCLGHFAWQALWPQLSAAGYQVPRPRPAFGHGAEAVIPAPPESAGPDGPLPDPAASSHLPPSRLPPSRLAPRALTVVGCYHPSQQNTFTGRVTDAMLDSVFGRAARLAGLASPAR
jgi:uracil-DNA glycosylase family 4